MTDFKYDHGLYQIAHHDIDLSSDTFKAALVMTNTTADTEKAKANLGAFTTLDRFDGSGYGDVTLTTVTITEDGTNHRAKIDCDDISFGALGAGTRNIQGMIIYRFVTNDAGSTPVLWVDSGGFPFPGNGSAVTIQISTDGLTYLE